MKHVYLLEHLHVLPENHESVKTLGIYESEADALKSIDKFRTLPGFRDFPTINLDSGAESGFYVSCYELGKDHWPEGFISVE